MGHLRLTLGYLKATVVHIRVTLGHLFILINILILPCNAYSSIVRELATSIYTGDFVPVYERGKKSIRMFSGLVQIFCLDFCFFWHFWIGSMDEG